MVASGELETMGGWVSYGASMNEGRGLFASGQQFGQWVKGNLPDTEQKIREAAMWTAANPDAFKATRKAHPNVRTVRGPRGKWKRAGKVSALNTIHPLQCPIENLQASLRPTSPTSGDVWHKTRSWAALSTPAHRDLRAPCLRESSPSPTLSFR